MDDNQWECLNCGGDVDADRTSCPHCNAAELAAAAALPADDDVLVAPLGASRTLGEDGQRRLAVALVSGFAVLLTGVGMFIVRDSTSSADRRGRTDEALVETTSTTIASPSTTMAKGAPTTAGTDGASDDTAGGATTSTASGSPMVLGVTVAPPVSRSRTTTTTRARSTTTVDTSATTDPAAVSTTIASTTASTTTSATTSTVAATTTTASTTTAATTTTVADGAGLPITVCPGDASDGNVPVKAAVADDGALCGRVFWQFERPGQFVSWSPVSSGLGSAAQAASLRVRYANGYGLAARATVSDGTTTQTVSWPSTGSWQTWATVSVPITVSADTVVRIDWAGAGGYSGDDATSMSLNIDQVRIVAA